MTRNAKLISSYKLLGISPEVIQSYYYDVPTKNIRRVAGLGAEAQGAGKYSQPAEFTRDRRLRPALCPSRLTLKYFRIAADTLTAACCQPPSLLLLDIIVIRSFLTRSAHN